MAAELFGHPARCDDPGGRHRARTARPPRPTCSRRCFGPPGWIPGVIGTTGLRIDGEAGPFARIRRRRRPISNGSSRGCVPRAWARSRWRSPRTRSRSIAPTASLRTSRLVHEPVARPPGLPSARWSRTSRRRRRCSRPSHARAGVVNADDAWARRLLVDPAIPTTTFGVERDADLRARRGRGAWRRDPVRGGRGGGAQRPSRPVQRRELPGGSGRRGARSTSRLVDAARAIASVPLVPGRMEPVETGLGFAVVVDYAHTPDSILHVLRGARALAAGRVIVVFGCGGDRDRAKRPMMGRAAAAEADLTVVTSDNPRTEDPEAIIAQIVAGHAAGLVGSGSSPTAGAAIALAVERSPRRRRRRDRRQGPRDLPGGASAP